MHKFFVEKNNISGDGSCIRITNDDVQHITKVLRLRSNDEIQVSDGDGTEYLCLITEMSKKEVICSIQNTFQSETEAPIKIVLFQGMPKSQKMDLIVQKCVELGITHFYPVITDRVVVKIEDRDLSGKIERWNRIAEEAAKQSNRGIVPVVDSPISFEKAIDLLKDMDLAVIPYELEKGNGFKSLLSGIKEVKTAGIFIGPEGGFTQEEVDSCIENNITPVTLGPRILRTETAGFTAATIIQYELGDMGGLKTI
jgi:16S rRNA (uracil1498-N3)-methyltransferase